MFSISIGKSQNRLYLIDQNTNFSYRPKHSNTVYIIMSDNLSCPYNGYQQTESGYPDEELSQTAPGTPMGELLRRYWHPVGLTQNLTEQPKLITVLGENLILFRDLSGRIGLVHKHCPHRRASLEFGRVDQRGIRCCYHGWHFDIDGSIIDIPGHRVIPKPQKKLSKTVNWVLIR